MKIKLLIIFILILIFISCASQKQFKTVEQIDAEQTLIENEINLFETNFKLKDTIAINNFLNGSVIVLRKGMDIKKIKWLPRYPPYGSYEENIIYLKNGIPFLIKKHQSSEMRETLIDGTEESFMTESEINYYILNWHKNEIKAVELKNNFGYGIPDIEKDRYDRIIEISDIKVKE